MIRHDPTDTGHEASAGGDRRIVSPAVLDGHVLASVAVSCDVVSHHALSTGNGVREIELPTRRSARLRFLRGWAKEQRRRALSGGAWSMLILPAFASAAVAQSDDWESLSSIEGVAAAEIQPDGSLAVSLNDGQTVVIPEGQFTVSADGQILVDAGALAGVAAGEGALAAIGAVLASAVAATSDGPGGASTGGGGVAGSTSTTGFVIDGYISGATVFRDENGNGVLDDGEVSTTTDAQGAFTLGGDLDAPIVSIGGVDISTGLPFQGTLKAPAGSEAVTPLTTLVQQIVEADESGATSVEDAVAQVNAALGLGAETDLLNEDPIASGNNELFAAGAKVMNIVNVGIAAGAGEGDIIEALADAIVTAEAGDTPLNDGETIKDVLEGALDGEDPSSDIDAVSETIANANNVVDERA